MIVPTLRLGLGLRFPGPGPSFASTASIIVPPTSLVFTTDFTALSALPTGVSLSRATTGDDFDGSGVLQTAAINAARFDHAWNGSAWVAKGLLIEEQRTNFYKGASDLNGAFWFRQDITGSTDGTLASDGVTQYALWTSSGLAEGYQHLTGLTSGLDATISFEAKAGAGNFIFCSFEDDGGPWFSAVFDLSQTTDQSPTQTAFGTSGGTASAKYLGNGRFRVYLTKSSIISSAGYAVIGIANAATGNSFGGGDIGTATNGKSAYFTFAQTEVGSFPTSYIPTTTAAVTRSADIPSSSSPLTGYLAAGPSVWEFQDEATGTIARNAYAAGAFDWPVNKWYRSMGVYAAGTDTSSHMTVGSAY